jgi:hypothetical protein
MFHSKPMLAVARCNLVFQHLDEYDGEDSYASQVNGAENNVEGIES